MSVAYVFKGLRNRTVGIRYLSSSVRPGEGDVFCDMLGGGVPPGP